MTIEVTGCHDCPYSDCDYEGDMKYRCNNPSNKGNTFIVDRFINKQTFHPSCPLQTESITIKKKDNDNTGICKERG